MADFEAAKFAFERLPGQSQSFHDGAAGAVPAKVDDCVDCFFFAFKNRFQSAVGQVADPAGYA